MGKLLDTDEINTQYESLARVFNIAENPGVMNWAGVSPIAVDGLLKRQWEFLHKKIPALDPTFEPTLNSIMHMIFCLGVRCGRVMEQKAPGSTL